MRQALSIPFFGRILPAAIFNLAAALALTLISYLDVLISPFGEWREEMPAPTTYRSPATYSPVTDELLSILGREEERTERFIVRRGETLSAADLLQLQRLLPERAHLDLRRAGGVLAFYFLTLTFFNLLLRRAGRKPFLRFRAVSTIYLVLFAAALASRLMLSETDLSPYALPVAFAAVLLSPLLGQNIGFAVHLLSLAIIAPMLSFTPGMVLIPLVSGWTAVLLLRERSGPLRMILACSAGALLGGMFLLGLALFNPQHIDFKLHLQGDLVGLCGGTLTCGLAAALLCYPITLMFGAVPTSRLRALLDLDQPLLKDLAEKAPGTFQHAMSMANMAEKVADEIGADAKLVRAGAYYHDIGKMQHPEYFIENQQGKNPHDQLAPAASAGKLRAHIRDGVTIARGANLPERLIDFIVEHHGNSTMEYFLDKAYQLEQKTTEPDMFQYQGRDPASRETALLMIVDSVEAASRTLRNPSHDDLENLVRRIIFSKTLHGYLDDSGLTTRDLKKIGTSLIKLLQGQFHVRVEYPWQKNLTGRPPLLVAPDTHSGVASGPASPRVAQPVDQVEDTGRTE